MRKHTEQNETPSADPVMGQADSVWELVNQYGTDEIQPTADTDDAFPKIAQGLPKKQYRQPKDDDTQHRRVREPGSPEDSCSVSPEGS